ncbi:phosphatidylglycerophosphatase A family protein [Sneathia sanguinegens]|uniref:phosphatidylglycerophosphatase A family protein n=1 Tax=Sneathia sanguinegens TaxID=40543 RepID=UPI0023F98270|nr:phosphatidylglycerophosphatase A [Sneathia sanguinegens]
MKYELYDLTISLIEQRGVKIRDIAELVLISQKKYYKNLTIEEAEFNVERVLRKREVQNVIITGIQLDKLAEEGKISSPLDKILMEDNPLYGVDEIMALSICNIYGSIGFTNYGYLDKLKPGILEKIDKKVEGKCNVFLDDLIGAVAAAACSRLAHNYGWEI